MFKALSDGPNAYRLGALKKLDPTLPVILLTANASQRSAIDALNLGAYQYLEKGAKLTAILDSVKHAAAAPRRSRVQRSGSVNQTRAPGSPSSIHSAPP